MDKLSALELGETVPVFFLVDHEVARTVDVQTT